MKFSQKIFLTVVICIIFVTLSINHEDNRSIKILEIAQAKSADTALWDNESYAWFATIIGSFARVLQNQPSKSQAERELRQFPRSKPNIKNGQYQGQEIYINNKMFMYIFFNYTNNYVSTVNIAFPSIKKSKMADIYQLLYGSLSKYFTETKTNVFHIENGYYAFIDQDGKIYSIQILKAKKSVVQ